MAVSEHLHASRLHLFDTIAIVLIHYDEVGLAFPGTARPLLLQVNLLKLTVVRRAFEALTDLIWHGILADTLL